MQQRVKSLICNGTGANSSNCYYLGLCSDIQSQLLPLVLKLSDNYTYTIPVKAYAIDDDYMDICRIKLMRSSNNYITLGTPWFKTFYTYFDSYQNVVGFALS